MIINCSPVGTFPNINKCPNIPYKHLTKEHVLYDLVYNPIESLFLRRGRELGCKTKNGLEMLEIQANEFFVGCSVGWSRVTSNTMNHVFQKSVSATN